MHPYRTPPTLDANANEVDDAGGLRLAIRVMTVVAAVQVATSVPSFGEPSPPALFGGACFIAGLVWLLRRRRR